MRLNDRGSRRASRRSVLVSLRVGVALLAGVMSLTGVAPAVAGPPGYVVNHGDGTVSVIDTATNAVVSTVTVGSEPLGAAVHPGGTRAYVTNQVAISGTVSVINTTTNGVVATVPVGSRPSGVAVKLPGDRVYVTNRDDKTVSVIDAASNAVVGDPIAVGNNPLGIAIDPAGSPAYVVNKGTNDVSVIDTVTNQVVTTIPVGNDPSQVAVSPNGRHVYVSNNSNASVSVIDTGLNSVVATIAVGNQPEGLALDPTGSTLYVANSGPNDVSVVDTATNAVTRTIDVGTTPFALALRPDGARLFVLNRQGGNVSVVDTTTNTIAATVDVGFGPSGMGQFIVPALRIPVFGSAARKCQAAVSRQGIKLATLQHGLEAACRLGVIKAEAAGKGTAAAEAACAKALDPADPSSKLARARVKLRAAVERACGAVHPGDLNGPCARGAAGFGATADCVSLQHGLAVDGMVGEEFSATRPVPLAHDAVTCQAAIAKNGRKLADLVHKDLGTCMDKILAATATGKGADKALAKCQATLDLGSALSKASAVRVKALVAIARKCAGVTPAALGSPCDAAAPDVATVASCVLAADVSGAGKMIAGEFNDACVTLTAIGLADDYLAVCSGH